MELESTLGGPECLLGPAGDAENDSRFFADVTDPFSEGVPFFSDWFELGVANLDLAFVDFVGVM